jgi:hypothetical protein
MGLRLHSIIPNSFITILKWIKYCRMVQKVMIVFWTLSWWGRVMVNHVSAPAAPFSILVPIKSLLFVRQLILIVLLYGTHRHLRHNLLGLHHLLRLIGHLSSLHHWLRHTNLHHLDCLGLHCHHRHLLLTSFEGLDWHPLLSCFHDRNWNLDFSFLIFCNRNLNILSFHCGHRHLNCGELRLHDRHWHLLLTSFEGLDRN